MTCECETLKLLKRLGLHKGGCPHAATCEGETCLLPAAQPAVEALNPDVSTSSDHEQEEALAEVLLGKVQQMPRTPLKTVRGRV